MTDGSDPIPPAISWEGDRIRLVDQRRLPHELVTIEARTLDELCGCIGALAIRGAPSLGVAGAMGVALAHVRREPLDEAARQLIATRPTAVNLAHGAHRACAAADPVAEALAMAAEEVQANEMIGAQGVEVVPDSARVLTHCHTGGLACVAYGTALGVIRTAHDKGLAPTVWIDETRPLLQGARLTAWELGRLGIACTLVVDAMAGSLMASGDVDLVLVGADRIAANGDVANKIGTYGLAVLAHHHGIPFYVAAPTSTLDPETASGAGMVVEDRDPDEVLELAGHRVAPTGTRAANRAFDVTPAGLVTAWITERGVTRTPPAFDRS